MKNFNWRVPVITLIVFCILTFGIFISSKLKNSINPEQHLTTDVPQTEVQTENRSFNTSYPWSSASDYPFTKEEVTVTIPNLSREYTIAWISDLHIINDYASGDVSEEFIPTVTDRYEHMAITSGGVHSADLWPSIIKYLNELKPDGIIFGGDIIDYCSHSNIALLKKGYDQLQAPVLYIRADHDYATWYASDTFTKKDASKLQRSIDGDDIKKKYLDFGEFMIVGINKSTSNISKKQLSIVEDLYASGKPIIAVTHVPYESKVDDSLKNLSMQIHNQIYYWGGGKYLPNESTQKYLDMIYSTDTSVKQVLSGHMHVEWDGMITKQVPEHVFSPAFQGIIGIVHVVPAS